MISEVWLILAIIFLHLGVLSWKVSSLREELNKLSEPKVADRID